MKETAREILDRLGYDNLFDLLRDFHQETADLFADGDKSRVEIHATSEQVSISVDGVDIDWGERLQANLAKYSASH